jgi:hypothetical protein
MPSRSIRPIPLGAKMAPLIEVAFWNTNLPRARTTPEFSVLFAFSAVKNPLKLQFPTETA